MKRTLMIIAAVLLPVSLFAQGRTAGIADNAGILDGAEKAELEKLIVNIGEIYNFDLLIVTEKDIGKADPIDYSWDLLINGYGLNGETWDGCLLLQATGSRDYCITASGRGSIILNKAAYDKLESSVVSYLKKDNYTGAYRAFISNWENFLTLEAKGRSYNFFARWNMVLVIGAWALSLLIGFIIIQYWKARMNTALPKKEADAYVVPGSLAFTQQTDRFLYSAVTKTARATSSSSSSSSGGSSRSGGGFSSRSGKY